LQRHSVALRLGAQLDVSAACFTGSASAHDGVGSVSGAIGGALIMGAMNDGTSSLGIGVDWQ
jgi:putative multiple sugar transport system permease protein